MRVRLEALCVLLEHARWAGQPLAVHVLCDVRPEWRDVVARVHAKL